MRRQIIILFCVCSFQLSGINKKERRCFQEIAINDSSSIENKTKNKEDYDYSPPKEVFNIFEKRLKLLDINSPMDLSYNDKVRPFIESYLTKNKMLIAKMKGISPYYFQIFEKTLDKYGLPLELKYLPIVESALNPKAKSSSGATGLWQFMYLTGKEYDLDVTSYIDERQDPIKSTEAACSYLKDLYEIFGDWNLVLAAYNGGPGYIQRKIENTEKHNFWELHEHLRRETRNYIPTFIAVNYVMNYSEEHEIKTIPADIMFKKTDTIKLKTQVDINIVKELTCINEETLNFLNPGFKKSFYPEGASIILPLEAANDFLLNQESNYALINMIENKQVLIDEKRIIYEVEKGDYLGKIAKTHDVRVFEIKDWNNLKTTKLDIGEKLVLFVKKNINLMDNQNYTSGKEYVIQKGDTLWEIAQKFNGVSVSKLKALNNLETDNLKPGTKIILPKT